MPSPRRHLRASSFVLGIWALTVTEGIAFLLGVVILLASRHAIGRGLAEGTPERVEAVLEQAEA